MSRGPLREALRLLEREGLVVAEQGRMVRVSPVSFSDLDELFALRIVNESFALRLSVPTMSAEHIDQAKQTLLAIDDAVRTEDWAAWRSNHRDFHRLLFEDAGDRTARFLQELFDHADRYLRIHHDRNGDAPAAAVTPPQRQSLMAVAAREHQGILQACVDRDAERAGTLMAVHLERIALRLFETATPPYEATRVREATEFVAGVGVARRGTRGRRRGWPRLRDLAIERRRRHSPVVAGARAGER
jgi:GntR family transcriptional regulator, rspAB operon transcriptional repressor